MRGITITLYEKKEVGRDAFNGPIYEETPEEIDNVLVSPSSTDEILSANQLYGKKAVYTMAIPKGDAHEWEGKKVSFFGYNWRVIECVQAGIESLVPTAWHKKATVERYG